MTARQVTRRLQAVDAKSTDVSLAVLALAMKYLDQPWKYYQLVWKIINT